MIYCRCVIVRVNVAIRHNHLHVVVCVMMCSVMMWVMQTVVVDCRRMYECCDVYGDVGYVTANVRVSGGLHCCCVAW